MHGNIMKTEYYIHKDSQEIYKRIMGMVFLRYELSNRTWWKNVGNFSAFEYILEPITDPDLLETLYFAEML
tara:strand:+ start:141 stop:353 length:213 start_codon:yes stop_codon:yes gene_type:complete